MAHGEPEPHDMERVVLMCDAAEGVFEKERMEEVRRWEEKDRHSILKQIYRKIYCISFIIY